MVSLRSACRGCELGRADTSRKWILSAAADRGLLRRRPILGCSRSPVSSPTASPASVCPAGCHSGRTSASADTADSSSAVSRESCASAATSRHLVLASTSSRKYLRIRIKVSCHRDQDLRKILLKSNTIFSVPAWSVFFSLGCESSINFLQR